MVDRVISQYTRWLVHQPLLKKYTYSVTTKFTERCKSLDGCTLYNARLCSTSLGYTPTYCKQENSPKQFSLPAKTNQFRSAFANENCISLYGRQHELFKERDMPGTWRYQIRRYSYEAETVSPVTGNALPSGLYAALCETPPVVFTQELLLKVHELSGFSWWSTIVLSTIFLRTCITLPLALYQNYILAKVENLKLEMDEIVKQLKRETNIAVQQFKWTEKYARSIYNRSLKKQWNKLIIRDNCHPAKAGLLVLVQLPMWVSLSLAIRNLVFMLPHRDTAAHLTYLELSGGGTLWFHCLLSADDTFLLPIILGLSNLAIVELQTLSRVREPGKLQKIATNFFRGLSIIMIPIAASVPSCLCLYWVTSSVFGLIQNIIVLSPKVRRFCRIPPCASVPDEPYSYIAAKLRARFGR